MNTKRRLTFALLASSMVGVLLFLYLHYSITDQIKITPNGFKHLFGSLLLANVAGLGIFYGSPFLNQLAPWHMATALRFIIELIVLGLCSFLVCFAALKLYLTWQSSTLPEFYATYHDAILKFIILGVVIIFIYTIIDFTLYSYRQYAALQIESVKVTSTQLALQVEVLKSQLSPHYLFNSLNTISSLVYSSPDQAEKFIRKLAQTYQYVLATQNKPLVPLGDELTFVKAYFYLLQARFAEAVHLTVDLPRRVLSSKIPPLTIQLLLENAVKHNTPSEENPLCIRIFLSGSNQLAVSNNLVTGNSKIQSFKVGLDNIRQRYHFFARAGIIITHAEDFKVELPLLFQTSLPA